MINSDLELIFSKNIKPINDSKEIINKFLIAIKKYQKFDGKGIRIYNFNTNEYQFYDSTKLVLIQNALCVIYDNFWQKEINFDPNWISSVELEISSIIKDNPELNYFFFKLDNKVTFEEKKSAILQIFFQCLKQFFIHKENSHPGIECSWFYLEFGKIFSDYYIDVSSNYDETFIDEVLVIFDKAIDKKILAFSKKTQPDLIRLYNKKFGSSYDNNYGDAIEHFFTKIISNKRTAIKNKLNIQYVEYSSIFLNILLSKFFNETLVTENKKTYKFFSPKGIFSELKFIIESKLPSINPELENCNSIEIKLHETDFNRKLLKKNFFLHKSNNINSKLIGETLKILKKLKKTNKFVINKGFLIILLEVFEKKNIELLPELYGINIVDIIQKLNNVDFSKKIIDWSLDLNVTTKIQLIKKDKSKFITQMINAIFSKKLSMVDMLKQACIMSCFDSFYFDWFLDSRGRLYTEQNSLSVQGSNLPRLLLSFFYENSKILKKENLDLMSKVKSTFVFDGKIKHNKYFNYNLLECDLQRKIPQYSTYALDASSSGLQMLTLCLKNKNLGKKCGLLKNDNVDDIYTRVSNHLNDHINSLSDNKNKFYDILNSIPTLKKLIQNRKFSKMPIMTIPYNSTLYGRVKQMEKVFIDNCFVEGILLSNSDIFLAKKFFFYIDKIIIDWCLKEIPECFFFFEKY